MLKLARPERFELPTFWFVARRSIQLSYGRIRVRCRIVAFEPILQKVLRPIFFSRVAHASCGLGISTTHSNSKTRGRISRNPADLRRSPAHSIRILNHKIAIDKVPRPCYTSTDVSFSTSASSPGPRTRSPVVPPASHGKQDFADVRQFTIERPAFPRNGSPPASPSPQPLRRPLRPGSASRELKVSASFPLPQLPVFSVAYKRVRNSLKTNTFRSLYFHTHAHSLSLFSCKSFICITYAKQPRGVPQSCPILGFSCGLYLQPAERKTSARRLTLRKVRKLNPLFSISSALFCAFAQVTFTRKPFIFYSLRTFSDNYRGWGYLRKLVEGKSESAWPAAERVNWRER